MDMRVDVEVDSQLQVVASRLMDGPMPTDGRTFSVNGSLNYQTVLLLFSSLLTPLPLVSRDGPQHAQVTTLSSSMDSEAVLHL